MVVEILVGLGDDIYINWLMFGVVGIEEVGICVVRYDVIKFLCQVESILDVSVGFQIVEWWMVVDSIV